MKFNDSVKLTLAALIASIFAFAFFSRPVADAQTKKTAATPTPIVKTMPAPTAKPATTPTVAPTVKPSPEDDDVLRFNTEEVNLNVRIIDRNNRPISNIAQNSVKVYEDNALQQITAFTKAEVPTNYSLVIDNSGSLRSQLEKVIEAGKIIVDTNRPDDETSVIRFVSSDKIEIMQDFTASKNDIKEALDNMYIDGGRTAIIDAVYLAAEKVDEYEKSRNPNDKKRRALILVSDGEDRDSFYNEQQLFELLRESDVQIYTIGFTTELTKDGGFITKSPRTKSESLMKRLAEETGGKYYFPQSIGELNDIAKNIASELRTQYLVSYTPTNDKKDGTFRAIKVTVDDGPNKEKRIAVTRTGRTAENENAKPSVSNQTQKSKTQ